MNKTQAVYNHLLTGASLTVKDSVELFKLYSLSQTLGKLRRNKGIPIIKQDIAENGVTYARYWLDKTYIEKVRTGEIASVWGANLATP